MIREIERPILREGQSIIGRRGRLPIIEVTAERDPVSGLTMHEVDLPTFQVIAAHGASVRAVPQYYYVESGGIAVWPRPAAGVRVRIVSESP